MINRRVAGAVVAISAATLAVAVPAEAARTAPKVHTIKLDSDALRQKDLKAVGLGADTDVVGKTTVGYDIIRFGFSKTSQTGDVALALQSGLLYGHLIFSVKTGNATGTVTGGTGTYAAAKGTITVTNASSKVAHVVIKWHK